MKYSHLLKLFSEPKTQKQPGLNEIEKVFPRRNIRYFVAPDGSSNINNSVERQKIVSKKIQKYRIIDFKSNLATTVRRVENAIKKIDPNSEVIWDNQRGEIDAIIAAEKIVRPTRKIPNTDRLEPSIEILRTNYLAFQILLKEYLEGRRGVFEWRQKDREQHIRI